MPFRSHWPLRRTRRGVELHLSQDELDFLRALAESHREQLGSDHPDLRRLFPTAYLEDPERDMEYQILARSELLDHRHAALDMFIGSLSADSLTDDEVAAWMQSINQFRLVLGTRLDMGEDEEEIDETAPDAAERALYGYLGVILGHLVEATPL